jgi:bifunctional non-homologous end joining protein LigD
LKGSSQKKVDSLYSQTRNRDWLKIKCLNSQEFVIGGYTDPAGSRSFFGALLLGYYDQKDFIYCGRVGTGFNEVLLKKIYTLLQKNKAKKSYFTHSVPQSKHVHWVKPKIVITIEFLEFTQDNILRHASFKGIRKDKDPKQVTREQ